MSANYVEFERRKLFDLKFEIVNNYRSTKSRNVSCSRLSEVFRDHKKTLKRLEKRILTDSYSENVNIEKQNIRYVNGRSINIWRYTQDLKNYCKNIINFNTRIKYPSNSTDIAQVVEGIFLHRKTLYYLEEIEKNGFKCKKSTSNNSNSVEQTIPSPQRNGASRRTSENEIDGPSTSKL